MMTGLLILNQALPFNGIADLLFSNQVLINAGQAQNIGDN